MITNIQAYALCHSVCVCNYDSLTAMVSQEVEGTWWWKDEVPLPQGHVKLETRNGEEMLLHDIRCDWGALDPYAAKFRRGKILRYIFNDRGLPLQTQECGTFTIRASPHRPMLARDFIAFE